MRAAAIAILLLLAAAPAAAAQDEVSQAVEALRSDSVYVAPGVDADLDAVRQEIADRELDLNVAVLPEGTGPEQAAAQIYRELGEGGTLAVVAGSRIAAGPSQDARDAADEAAEAKAGEDVEAVLLDFVDREDGSSGGTGALILLGLAGAGGAALIIGRRRRRREEAAAFADVKGDARDDLVVLGDEIRALDLDMQMPDAPGGAKTDFETAVNAYERANRAYETARRPDDLEPVGAALEEGRWAMLSARARLDGREPPERSSPCFFDPRHGPSAREVEWTPDGGAPRMVPACEADAERVERGEDPQAREVTVGGERMPYWSAGPAYAPFMGGFYGTGILPGLLVGTMLGGMWDSPGGGDFGGGDFGGGGFGGGDFGGGFGGGDF